ncbi:hypothetical protein [Demequina pelophila]|uniref:hypothetical protein n=1 Tax=Demequina pelophila TaxID=1638984 RepID=UPI0007844BB7|nr:hypothetical protein [Demequina pelophila]
MPRTAIHPAEAGARDDRALEALVALVSDVDRLLAVPEPTSRATLRAHLAAIEAAAHEARSAARRGGLPSRALVRLALRTAVERRGRLDRLRVVLELDEAGA